MSYSAHLHSLGTAREHQTKDEATADPASTITFLCEHESAEVKIASVRGHVGVFSYTAHAAPPANSTTRSPTNSTCPTRTATAP